MGLFDRLKKQPKQTVQGEKYLYSMPIQGSEEEIIALNIEKINTIKHRNNELTDLMMARIIQQDPQYMIYVDDSDYVTFELPQGMKVNDEIMQIVMKQYQQGNVGQQHHYLGRLLSDRNVYRFGNKSLAVEKIATQKIQERIQQKREQTARTNQGYEQNEKRRREAFLERVDAREHLNELEEERNQRRQFPTLRRVYAYEPLARQGQKTYSNYDGVNVETGDILRIRQVDKIGKDGSGTYLYSAYIYNTPNEYDVERFKGQPNGVAVCFELQKKLEDIVNGGDINEITQVLQLLSDRRNFDNPEQLSYIGEIDKNGQANRRAISSSSAIQSAIVNLQRQFAEKMREKQEGRQSE